MKRKPACIEYNYTYEDAYKKYNDCKKKYEDICNSKKNDSCKKKCDYDRCGKKDDDCKDKYDDDYDCKKDDCKYPCDKDKKKQRHVHEYTGSTKLAEKCYEAHNHRFAGVTGEAIPYGKSHVHKLYGNSDFTDKHYHDVDAVTGPAIYVGRGKHVHPVCGVTSKNDGHTHKFVFATLIESPID